MVNWDYYKNAMINSSKTSKQELIEELQHNMSDELSSNYITGYEVKVGMKEYNETLIKNFTTEIRDCVISQERYKEKIYNLNVKTLLSPVNTFNTGDYVTRKENGIDEIYIVRARVERKPTYDSSFIMHCQYNVNILDDDGATIRRFPASFSDNKSRPGTNERADAGVTENSTFQAYIKHDDISRRFIANTNGKQNRISRILIDGLAYKIVGSDPASMRGLITLGLELDVVTPYDNLELGIADYYKDIPEQPATDEIVGDSDLWIGDTNTYTVDTNNTVTWGLTNNGSGVTLGLTGKNGECTVTSKMDTKLIGRTEILTAYLDYGATFTKTITITSRI